MAGTTEYPDVPEMGPGGQYTSAPPSQYPQPSYSYTRGSANYPVEQQMTAVENFNRSAPASMDSMQDVSASNGQASGAPATPSHLPDMAPPQSTHHQQYPSPPSGPRLSMDDAQDITPASDSKRKRSKVSRACDECRRKKVRCDAQDDDGNIKTCSNCARLAQICEYSRIPMKRGPSKGYIKELSDRVHHVESQMAMGGQQGYRQSLDGNMQVYPESYSPDEIMSARRDYSFSDGKNNPFAQPHFNDRERMPSMGGWSNASGGAGYKSRDRFSVAVAPDQLADAPTSNGPSAAMANLVRPFWARDDLNEPPSKRQRLSADDAESPQVDLDHLMSVVERVDKMVPIFSAKSRNLLQSTRPSLCHALYYALCALTRQPRASNSKLYSYEELESFVWNNARDNPADRPPAENVVWLWLYCVMLALAHSDIGRQQGSDRALPQSTLIKLAMDLSSHLRSSGEGDAILAADFVATMSRLHEIAVGHDPTHFSGQIDLPDSIDLSKASYFAQTADVLSVLSIFIQSELSGTQYDVANTRLIRTFLSQMGERVRTKLPEMLDFGAQFTQLIEFLLLRHSAAKSPAHILKYAEDTLLYLAGDLSGSAEVRWTPFRVPLFIISTITLAEFVDTVDTVMASAAQDALSKLESLLQTILSHDVASLDKIDGYPLLHWADALLVVVRSRREARPPPNTTNGITPSGTAPTTRNNSNLEDNAMTDSGRQGTSGSTEDASRSGDPAASRMQENNQPTSEPQTADATSPTNAASLLVSRQVELASLPAAALSAPGGLRDKILDSQGSNRVQIIDFRLLGKVGWMTVLTRLTVRE